MSETLHFCPSMELGLPRKTSRNPSRDLSKQNAIYRSPSLPSFRESLSFPGKSWDFHFPEKVGAFKRKVRAFNAWNESESSLKAVDLDDYSPVSVELMPICCESQFDRVIAEAQQLEESVVVLWMASWCRKCIYLKPKLEKLAAEYHPRLRFYCVDVNNVPHKLVARAGVTKMPIVQLWKDSKKQAEVIGGHKAYLVINEVRDMIESESST